MHRERRPSGTGVLDRAEEGTRRRPRRTRFRDRGPFVRPAIPRRRDLAARDRVDALPVLCGRRDRRRASRSAGPLRLGPGALPLRLLRAQREGPGDRRRAAIRASLEARIRSAYLLAVYLPHARASPCAVPCKLNRPGHAVVAESPCQYPYTFHGRLHRAPGLRYRCGVPYRRSTARVRV